MRPSISAFLSYGFRPFFLLACVYACLSMAAWIAMFAGDWAGPPLAVGLAPVQWHAHEMLFGYTVAVISGFFLTAVPGWTKSRPVQGPALGALAAVWAAGRLAVWVSAALPPLFVAFVDLAFIPCLLAMVIRALVAGWSKRNLVFLPVLAALFVANLLVHLESSGITQATVGVGHMLALNVVMVLIAIIGGRVVPAFTTNALRRKEGARLPETRGYLDVFAILSVVAVVAVDLIAPGGTVAGVAAAFAAIVNGLRLSGWRSLKTLDQPILWVVHLGYAWLVIGLALKALALLGSGIDETTAIHALTVGAIGTMTIGIMTRAGLGHTGRVLRVAPSIAGAYVLLSVVAAIRVIVPVWLPHLHGAAMVASGIGWIVVFAVVTVVYWPILTGPRLSDQAG